MQASDSEDTFLRFGKSKESSVRNATHLWEQDSGGKPLDDMENARIDDSDGETQAQMVKYRNTVANKF